MGVLQSASSGLQGLGTHTQCPFPVLSGGPRASLSKWGFKSQAGEDLLDLLPGKARVPLFRLLAQADLAAPFLPSAPGCHPPLLLQPPGPSAAGLTALLLAASDIPPPEDKDPV